MKKLDNITREDARAVSKNMKSIFSALISSDYVQQNEELKYTLQDKYADWRKKKRKDDKQQEAARQARAAARAAARAEKQRAMVEEIRARIEAKQLKKQRAAEAKARRAKLRGTEEAQQICASYLSGFFEAHLETVIPNFYDIDYRIRFAIVGAISDFIIKMLVTVEPQDGNIEQQTANRFFKKLRAEIVDLCGVYIKHRKVQYTQEANA